MAPSLVRTEGAAFNPTARYYQRRVAARSGRPLVRFNVPAAAVDPKRPQKEDTFSTRMDVLGPLIREHYPVVPSSCQRNLMAAFDKRCNYHTDRRADRDVVKASLHLLDRISPSAHDPLVWGRSMFESWNSQFNAEKRARHEAVYPLVSQCTVRQFTDKQIFVKVEALLKRHDSNWAPRIIYQSSDLHNVILGPVMQACSKRMFAAMDIATDPSAVCFSGAYRKQTEELCDFIVGGASSGCQFVESDFSSNDQTQVRDVHVLEVDWLRRFGAPLWVTSLMLHANSFAVTSKGFGLRAKIRNQLPTGAQSTTFRNTLWNASIVEAFAVKHKLRGKCLVLGDDMLFRVDNPFTRVGQMRRAYTFVTKSACMVAKVFVRKHLSECTFLSKQFIMTSFGYVLVPKLGKALARFNASANNNQSVSDRAYLAGKSLSYAYEFRHCPPVSRCFLERYRQLSSAGLSLVGLGWNVRGAFLDLGVEGVLRSISRCKVASRDDITRFYHWKYSLTCTDVVELCLRFVFGEFDLDVAAVGRIIEDFVD